MKRRAYLVTAGTVLTAGLAGCLSELSVETEENGASGSNGEEDRDAIEVVDTYIDAASEEDFDRLADVMHSNHPFNPDTFDTDQMDEDGGWSFESKTFDSYETELAKEDFVTSEIKDLPHVEFWFQDTDLNAILDGEEAALVSVAYETTEDGKTVEDEEQIITLTEDGEWTVFSEYEAPPEIPDEDPIDDEAYRIVDELSFNTETERVTITLEDAIEIDINEVIAYSESLETESSVTVSGDGYIDYFTSGFDPTGDEIVVTMIANDEEVVVHRESYDGS